MKSLNELIEARCSALGLDYHTLIRECECIPDDEQHECWSMAQLTFLSGALRGSVMEMAEIQDGFTLTRLKNDGTYDELRERGRDFADRMKGTEL